MNSQADQARALGKPESTSGVRLSRSVIAEQSVMRAYDGKRRHREERSKKPDTIPNEHTGDCSPDAHARLQEVVDARCRDSAGMRCDKGMSLDELKQNLSRASQCVDAQKEINERCFRGGDDIHKKKVRERTVPVGNCKELIQRETERQKLREFLETAGWASAAILAVYAIVVWAPAMVLAALMAAGASRVFAFEAMEYAGIKSANPNENDDEGRSGERPAHQLQNDGITKTESESVPKVIQPKLIVNTPGDKYEQEADRVAEQVMRMPEPKVQRQCACGKSSTEDECSECKTKKHDSIGSLQRVASSPVGGIAAPPIVDRVLSSPGSPLPEATRTFMETRFGQDFSHVRTHTDQRAVDSAASVHARAYTVGSNIVFGRGESPSNDKHLLAHELTHTLQQGGANGSVVRREVSQPPLSAPGQLTEYQKNKYGGHHVFEYKEGTAPVRWIDPYKIEFLKSAGFDVYQAARKKGFSPFGSLFVLAQASLESDWGKGNWASETHNLFSIMGGSNKKYSNSHGTLSKFDTNEEGFEAYVSLIGRSDRWPTTVEAKSGMLRLDSFTADDVNKAFHQKPYYAKGGPAYNADPNADYGQDLLDRMKFLVGPLLASLQDMTHPPTAEPLLSEMAAHFRDLLAAKASLVVSKKTPASTSAPTVTPTSGEVKRKANSTGGGMEAPPIVDRVLSSPGSPLPESTRTFMESRFGKDFRHVRVHTDQQAAESAAAVQAQAYTVGHNIVFGRGESLASNRQLLAHELTHVVQQQQHTRDVQRKPIKISKGTDTGRYRSTEFPGIVFNSADEVTTYERNQVAYSHGRSATMYTLTHTVSTNVLSDHGIAQGPHTYGHAALTTIIDTAFNTNQLNAIIDNVIISPDEWDDAVENELSATNKKDNEFMRRIERAAALYRNTYTALEQCRRSGDMVGAKDRIAQLLQLDPYATFAWKSRKNAAKRSTKGKGENDDPLDDVNLDSGSRFKNADAAQEYFQALIDVYKQLTGK